MCRSALRRRSAHLTKNLTASVGGYLPNTLTEMWEPSRDFAFLRLPTSGARCIAALSGCVLFLDAFDCDVRASEILTRVVVAGQDDAAGDGALVRGLLLLVQHRPRERRRVLADEAVQVRSVSRWPRRRLITLFANSLLDSNDETSE